tara:strand:+ start:606 stop:1577 length:972 start_codon:yes stop_codon:yes gene_type:complete
MENTIFIKEEELQKLEEALSSELGKVFASGDKIAVKLHMGEKGNKYYLKPELVKRVISVMKKLGLKPFLFDSPVKYNSMRHTVEGYEQCAKEHGFTEKNVDCDVIISNEAFPVEINEVTYEVCKPLVEADGVLVLSHVKGHFCSGFGAAIKNLGMGAMTKESKGDIHEGGEPKLVGKCVLCKECAKVCPTDNVRYDEEGVHFDKSWCCGCSNCTYACKYDAIKPKVKPFDTMLAEGAYAALKNFKKSYFINVLRDIAEKCDCASDAGEVLIDDIGIVLSNNIIDIEKASHELIVEKAGKDLFKEVHHKSPMVHIKEMELCIKK